MRTALVVVDPPIFDQAARIIDCLLWYAFEKLRYRRVELKADVENTKSRAAIARLGAQEEGIFRKHVLYEDGRNRDNVYFSIIDDDWPLVRTSLEQKLGYQVTPTIE